MADCREEIHVGDVGTLYRGRVLDACVPFDPSAALIKQFIFELPGGVVITKNADSVTNNGSPATEWFLEYTIKANDGLGSPPGDFHDRTGRLKVQIYLEWADGSHFHSSVVTSDTAGRELRIFANLA